MNIFVFSDYRAALKGIVQERKVFDRRFGFHTLADAARIQRPYMSKVMQGTAHLSMDQMFLITDFLDLGADEQKYLELLLESERTAIDARKKKLAKEIKRITEKNLDPAVQLGTKTVHVQATGAEGAADYYLDPLMQIVHVGLSIDRFSRNPVALAEELHISSNHLRVMLSTLEKIGFIFRDGQKYKVNDPSLHLPKASPLFRAWRNQTHFLSLEKINRLSEQETYSFSTVFSADGSVRKHIQTQFLEFLKSSEKAVKAAESENVFQMSFDIFPWTGT